MAGQAGRCGLRCIAGNKIVWRSRRDSNPQHPDRQSGALPLSYATLVCLVGRTGFEPVFSVRKTNVLNR